MKILFLFILSCFAGIAGYFFGISVEPIILSTLYVTVCIMFSVSMAFIALFPMSGVQNPVYIKYIRKMIKSICRKFIILYTACTSCLIINWSLPKEIYLDLSAALVTLFLLSICYYIYNFRSLQKLNEDIFERVLDEKYGVQL